MITMNIGKWLLQMRHERNLDLRALAALTGLDIGTISKIENGRTQATLGTIVRSGVGMDVTATEFIQDWQGVPFSLVDGGYVSGEKTAPTLRDVEAVITCARMSKVTICDWLANALNSIASLQGEAIPPLAPEEIEKFLFGPLWLYCEVQYPAEMAAEDILDILKQDGVVIMSDIAAYLRKCKSTKQLSSERIDALLKISLGRIKMNDILILDQEFEQGGKIVAMYWHAYLFHEGVLRSLAYPSNSTDSWGSISTEQKVRLALMFITICRWLQHVRKNDTSWIRDLRLRFQQLYILH